MTCAIELIQIFNIFSLIAGCAGLLVGHPFDTVKVHIQTQDFRNPKYRSTFHCLKSIIVKDSVRGLYRGLSSPLAGVSFVNAIVFGIYGNVQRYVGNSDSYKTHFVAGATAGLVQSFICSPMELAKTRLQLQHDKIGCEKFRGPRQCLSYIYRCEGLPGIFRGLSITAMRDVPGFASYFVAYEWFIRAKQNPGILYTLFAGGSAGIVSWLLTIPIDVVKSRIQADGMSGTRPMYNGIGDCLRKSYAQEGLSFFTRGLSSTLLRAFPMNAICFLVVSSTVRFCDNYTNPMTRTANVIKLNAIECQQRRNKIVQGILCFGGAFSEAICCNELVEIANEWYDFNGAHGNYHTINENFLPLAVGPV